MVLFEQKKVNAPRLGLIFNWIGINSRSMIQIHSRTRDHTESASFELRPSVA